MQKRSYLVALLWCGILLVAGRCLAAADGQADLDKAMDLKLKATTLEELAQVVTLCEQAVQKGLPPDDEAFAKRLLIGALYQRSRPQVEVLVSLPQFPPEARERRKDLLADLRKILKHDDQFGQAYLMIAQLEALPGGERQEARQASDRAVELLASDKETLAKAYLVRGELQETEEARLADFDRAIEANPDDPQVWQMRAFYHLMQGQVEKALADFNSLLAKDSENLLARLAIADTLLKLDKVDEAMKHVNHIIETRPNVMVFKLRAQLWVLQERLDKAKEDVERAMQLDPQDLDLFLMRARLYYMEERNALALADVNRVLENSPNNPAALDLRSSISATMGALEDALRDITLLLQRDPKNLQYRLQWAIYLNADGKSYQAINVFSDILRDDPGNSVAFRGRADAYLNVGAHREAIGDYEAVVKAAADDSGVLNNYAWVLATSPEDQLRNGTRAVELALKACELTEYKQAHILSTLAAAYAEVGDWANAVKWSQQACELGDESVKQQLQQELESYRKNKPWRERKSEETPKAEAEKEPVAESAKP